MMGGRVVEADGAADQANGLAASILPKDLVPLAEILSGQIKEIGADHTWVARQSVPFAVRHEREIARMKEVIGDACDLKPTLAGRHDMEHQGARHRGKVQAPWRGEFAATVIRALHPQNVERLAKRIDRGP